MTILHLPVAYGAYPEDGEEVSDLAFESEEEALDHGDEMTSGDYGLSYFFVKEVEVVESERP